MNMTSAANQETLTPSQRMIGGRFISQILVDEGGPRVHDQNDAWLPGPDVVEDLLQGFTPQTSPSQDV